MYCTEYLIYIVQGVYNVHCTVHCIMNIGVLNKCIMYMPSIWSVWWVYMECMVCVYGVYGVCIWSVWWVYMECMVGVYGVYGGCIWAYYSRSAWYAPVVSVSVFRAEWV